MEKAGEGLAIERGRHHRPFCITPGAAACGVVWSPHEKAEVAGKQAGEGNQTPEGSYRKHLGSLDKRVGAHKVMNGVQKSRRGEKFSLSDC